MSRPNSRPRSDSNERLRSEIESLKLIVEVATQRKEMFEAEFVMRKKEDADRVARHEERLYRLLQIGAPVFH